MDKRRKEMVDEIKRVYGLKSPKVLSTMLKVPRHMFVSKLNWLMAYRDGPVSIGYGQTMSQPYTVAFMTHLLVTSNKRQVTSKKMERVLEVGTGSGYQAAVLSLLVGEVYSVEIIPELADKARDNLKKLNYKNVFVKAGSGGMGWKEKAPFDGIMITAGLDKEVPKALIEQLKVSGVLVAPIGKGHDKVMTKYEKLQNSKSPKFKKTKHGVFHFVPFVESKS